MPDDFAAWVASPRRAVDWLLHAAAMDTAPMGLDRSVNPPGISATIADLLQALDAVRPGASALVRRVEDPAIAAIVGTWPPAFEPLRARTLGFAPHEPLAEVIRAFIADDLAATRAERGLPPEPLPDHRRKFFRCRRTGWCLAGCHPRRSHGTDFFITASMPNRPQLRLNAAAAAFHKRARSVARASLRLTRLDVADVDSPWRFNHRGHVLPARSPGEP